MAQEGWGAARDAVLDRMITTIGIDKAIAVARQWNPSSRDTDTIGACLTCTNMPGRSMMRCDSRPKWKATHQTTMSVSVESC